MTTSSVSPSTIGWMSIAIGGTVILAVIFLILMYTVNGRFGTINDVLNALIGILSVVLAWMLQAAIDESGHACACSGWHDLYHHRL